MNTHTDTQAIEKFIEEAMSKWQVPGASICIVRDGETIMSSAFGTRDLATDEPATRETVFWIASNTKAITSFSLALLVEDGLLDWDEPIRTYMPSLHMATSELTEHVTVRDLLCHRTGIPSTYGLFMWNPALSRKDLFERLAYLAPNKPFRTTFQYNNLMYTLAGYLVEVITGSSWETFVENRIFTPLGISTYDFNFLYPRELPDLSTCYLTTPKGPEPFPTATPWEWDSWTPSPAGGVNTNIIEMEKWLRLHLDGGAHSGTQLVTEQNLKTMYAPHVPVAPVGPFPELSYSSAALGWQVSYHRGVRKVSHGGALGSYVAFLPDHNIGVVMLTNMSTPLAQATTSRIFDELLKLEPAPWIKRFSEQQERDGAAFQKAMEAARITQVAGTTGTFAPDDLVGTYTSNLGGNVEITADRGTLYTGSVGMKVRLERFHYDTYIAQIPYPRSVAYLSFTRGVDGKAVLMTLQTGGGVEARYTKKQ